jgi:aminoglycoside phosphotransferase (APT) family kinase protein
VELLAAGRDADVFALDAQRVLRRYRDGGDVTAEVAVMAHVAADGFPVPEVFAADGADLVMTRVAGPTMLTALVSGDVRVDDAARTLAALLHRLHAVPPRGATGSVLHRDLHPDNVILSPTGPVVIDWRDTTEGPPDLDVALTALIIAQVAVDDSPLTGIATAVLTAFLAHARGNPAEQLGHAVTFRRANPTLTEREAALLTEATRLVRAQV